jgi:hypothetical protein
MLFVDKYPKIKSDVIIIAYDRNDCVLWVRHEGENKLVTTGRQLLSRLLGGLPGLYPQTIQTATRTVSLGGPADLFIEYMRWGSGGHNPVTNAALGVSPSEESLAAPLASLAAKTVYAVNYPGTPPSDKTIEFVGRIDYSEANGETISEFGLFNRLVATANSLMFAKKNFGPPIVKDASFRLEFKHRIIM